MIFEHRWDRRFMALAKHVATWSKDPSTQVGAVVVDAERRVLGLGYNGFPRGIDDRPERYDDRAVKYSLVVHAEINAILNSSHTKGATLYTSFPPCQECAKVIIQAGIARVIKLRNADTVARWAESMENGHEMLREAGVEVGEVQE